MKKIIRHQKLPTNWDAREKLREKGQFWTPLWVSQAMVSYVLKSSPCLFDPAAGRGAFLEGAIHLGCDFLYYGTDIDEDVIADHIYDRSGVTVEKRDFLVDPPHKKFSAIVANPPYIRHHRLDAETKRFLKELCYTITGFTIDGRAGYHIYFLLQALSLLDQDGRLAFIMPADTAEGKFAHDLWKWIAHRYCLEAVIAFDHEATPFPGVDTNPLVFLIRNTKPDSAIWWIKCREPHSPDLYHCIHSDFSLEEHNSLDVSRRSLAEALETGLSRPKQSKETYTYRFSDFARVIRGIATGANDFFFLTKQQAEEIGIPDAYLRIAVGRTKDVEGDILTAQDIENLDRQGRPTRLLCLNGYSPFPKEIEDYILKGEQAGLPDRPLIQQRKPWYKMESRDVPPLLFTYLGRRHTRFIRNYAGAIPLTCFLCIYPKNQNEDYVDRLWKALNDPETIQNMALIAKSYGAGAMKVEPRGLDNLPIPESVVERYNLIETSQLSFISDLEREVSL